MAGRGPDPTHRGRPQEPAAGQEAAHGGRPQRRGGRERPRGHPARRCGTTRHRPGRHQRSRSRRLRGHAAAARNAGHGGRPHRGHHRRGGPHDQPGGGRRRLHRQAHRRGPLPTAGRALPARPPRARRRDRRDSPARALPEDRGAPREEGRRPHRGQPPARRDLAPAPRVPAQPQPRAGHAHDTSRGLPQAPARRRARAAERDAEEVPALGCARWSTRCSTSASSRRAGCTSSTSSTTSRPSPGARWKTCARASRSRA
jgi:hypothetical protein